MRRHVPDPIVRRKRRKRYAAPFLREFGPLGSLTQAGTGMQPEMGNSMSRVHRI